MISFVWAAPITLMLAAATVPAMPSTGVVAAGPSFACAKAEDATSAMAKSAVADVIENAESCGG